MEGVDVVELSEEAARLHFADKDYARREARLLRFAEVMVQTPPMFQAAAAEAFESQFDALARLN